MADANVSMPRQNIAKTIGIPIEARRMSFLIRATAIIPMAVSAKRIAYIVLNTLR